MLFQPSIGQPKVWKKALVSWNPAIIVTDIMMPKVSGVQMIAEMRKHPELADVPIVLLTAKADENLKIKLLAGKRPGFLWQSLFSEKDLLVRVRNLIELKKSQERHRTLFKSMDEAGFAQSRSFSVRMIILLIIVS